jgi:hypothetical protein|tara:strand:- start:4634 stop:5995 length:1362 start_codon:yes stop_codon:yes gene_type:complete
MSSELEKRFSFPALEERLEKAYSEIPARVNRLLEADKSRGGIIARDPQAVKRLEDRMRQRISQDLIRESETRVGGAGRPAPLKPLFDRRYGTREEPLPAPLATPVDERGARVAPEDLSRFSKDPLADIRAEQVRQGRLPEFYGKTDAASRRQLFEFAREGLGGPDAVGARGVLAREFAEKSGVSADQFNRTMRRELFDQVKQRAQERNLTPEQFEGFRRSAEGLGVTGQMFDSTFQKEGITAAVGSGETTPDPADFDRAIGQGGSPQKIKEKPEPEPKRDRSTDVRDLLKQGVGAGLRRQDFASADAYAQAIRQKAGTEAPLGTSSPLRQTPRELGRLSGAMNRAGRRLIRKGAARQGFAMFGQAEAQRLNEGSAISTPERRAREEEERRQQINLIGATQQRMRDYQNLRNQMGTGVQGAPQGLSRPIGSNIPQAGSPTSNIRQSPMNKRFGL